MADTIYGKDTWNVYFTADDKMESSFKSSEMTDSISGMQPGDTAIFTVTLGNQNETTTDWYMTNKVLHSLEDRIVKNYFRNLGKQCVCPPEVAVCRCGGSACAELITRKPVAPTAEEVKVNSPSRSAKLRVIRKIKDDTEYHLDGVVGF